MPWKYADKTLREGRGWTDDNGFKHPYNWASAWTDTDKKNWGVTWEDPPASEAAFDNRFYWGRQTDGSLIERSLTDVNVFDEDGKAVNDPITGQQMVTLGLKSIWVEQTKRTANNKLSLYDWMVTRKAEKSTAIPTNVQTYRDAVRTKCAEIETALNAASDLAAFMALFEDERNSDGTVKIIAKINDWPNEI